MMRHREWLLLLALALIVGVHTPANTVQEETVDALEMGRQFTAWFYEGKLDRIWDRLSGRMQQVLVAIDSFEAFRTQAIDQQLGAEIEILNEEVQSTEGYQVYVRTVRFANLDGPIIVQWAFDSSGTVGGFFIRPKPAVAATEYLDYETKTALRLPFEGEWYVFWGGRTPEENYHVIARDQRFAYDFLIMRGENSHTAGGTANEQYFCFGEPILAPAAGAVVSAVDGISDNVPSVMNPRRPLGNHVVLDHGNGEYSFLAHFKEETVQVETGERVEAGDLLGRCGNSGNSSEPHLHYHLQTNALFGRGDGLPAQFLRYVANGEPVARGEPLKGESILNQQSPR